MAAPAAASRQAAAELAEARRQFESLRDELNQSVWKCNHHRREEVQAKADLSNLRDTELELREKLADVTKELTSARVKEAARLRGEARDQRSSTRESASASQAASLLLAAAERRESLALAAATKARAEADLTRKEKEEMAEKMRITETDRDAARSSLSITSYQSMLLQRRLERALTK
eukprot:5300348-Pleurochrysis_carterae.AAC.1